MKSKGMRINDRDIQILETLHNARYLTTQQIQMLFWNIAVGEKGIGPMKACQRRLRLLTKHGLVRRIEQPIKRTEPTKPYLYTLDRKGAEILAAEMGLSLSDIDYSPSSVEENYPFLDHLIATTDVRIAIKQACDMNGLKLVEWVDEKELQSPEWKVYVYISSPDGKRHRVALIPDAYLTIQSGTKTMRFFFEIDRGTHTIHSKWNRGWKRKVLSYNEYFSSDAYQERFEKRQVFLLTVTTTDKRLATLKKATEENGGGGRFLFATQADASDAGKVLEASIWHTAGLDVQRELLKKQEKKEPDEQPSVGQ